MEQCKFIFSQPVVNLFGHPYFYVQKPRWFDQYLSIPLSIYLSIYLSIIRFIHLCIYVSASLCYTFSFHPSIVPYAVFLVVSLSFPSFSSFFSFLSFFLSCFTYREIAAPTVRDVRFKVSFDCLLVNNVSCAPVNCVRDHATQASKCFRVNPPVSIVIQDELDGHTRVSQSSSPFSLFDGGFWPALCMNIYGCTVVCVCTTIVFWTVVVVSVNQG